MQIHGPSIIHPDLGTIAVGLNTVNAERAFASVTFPGGLNFYVYGEAEADSLIKVFCQVKDMLHKHAAAMAPLPDRGRYDAGSAAEVAQGLPAAMEQAYVNTGLNAVADLASTGLTYSDAALKLQAEIDAAVREVQP